MRFTIFTLFPEFFTSPLETSLFGKARETGLVTVDFVNLRDFGEGKYRAVDDRPYGGGAGMVLMPTVLEKALASLLGSQEKLSELEKSVQKRLAEGAQESSTAEKSDLPHVVYLSPQGKPLCSKSAKELTTYSHIVLICGHYEGIDERAVNSFVHEEISIGDYILTGGEPAALVVMDAASRFIPGVIGEMASVTGDTFESADGMVAGGLKYPVYTRPPQWREKEVPEILLSGNHGEISKWRLLQSQKRTSERRPDLLPASATSKGVAPLKKR